MKNRERMAGRPISDHSLVERSTKDGSWCLLIANGRKQTRASQCLPIIMYANVEICEFLQCGSWENIWSMAFPSALLCSMHDLGVKGSPVKVRERLPTLASHTFRKIFGYLALLDQPFPRAHRLYRANISFDLKLYHRWKRKSVNYIYICIHIRVEVTSKSFVPRPYLPTTRRKIISSFCFLFAKFDVATRRFRSFREKGEINRENIVLNE